MALMSPRLPISSIIVSILKLSIIICILANNLKTYAIRDVLEQGSSLTPASDPLISASSNFTLSFRDPHLATSSSGSSSSNLFLAVCFVVDSSLDYPVWVANRNASVSASASLNLSSSGDLLLLSDAAVPSSLIWKSNTTDLGVVRAQLLDSGNLVLLNNKAEHVWQSFNYPTDTLLPGQYFTANSTTLISNKKIGDFHTGRYSHDFISLVQVYNQQYDSIGNVSSMQFDDLGKITFYGSDPPSSSNSFDIVSNDHGVSGMRRMTLDVDGNLRLYTWDVDAAQWKGVWMLLLSVCRDVRPGVCGSYGVCTYDPFKPTCMCPHGFSVVDATDISSGCAATHMVADYCSANSTFKFLELENVDFPDNDYTTLTALSIEECKKECLNSCICLAAVYTQTRGICWLKRKVENGYVQMDQSSRVFLKVSAADPSVSSPIVDRASQWNPDKYLWQPLITYTKKTNMYFSTVIALAVLIAIESMCCAATVAGLITKSRRQLKLAQLGEELEASPRVYSYGQLTAATENFSHKLGEGGFGTVYRGQLQSGRCIAVKRLEGLLQQEKQFRAEIMTLGRIHHINLLCLVGFCSEGNHRLLVYEYMEKGSLDQVLLQAGSGKEDQQIEVLDWSKRYSICLGVARGIHDLHEECLNCILHCDIKPHNILLDSSFCAKVADFGLAYLHTHDQKIVMTTIRGTRGYLAPEWVSGLPVTAKADVYSYGMLIMEIISGRSNYLYSQSQAFVDHVGEKWCFPMWAYGKRIEEVVDIRLRESSIDWQQVMDMVLKVAFCCIQADMNKRPTMGQVLQMLEGALPLPLNVPPPSLTCIKEKGGNDIALPSPQVFMITSGSN